MTRVGWDVHAHLFAQSLVEAARANRFSLSFENGNVIVPGAHMATKSLTDSDALLARLDANGLAGACISVPPGLFRYDLPPEEAASFCALVNDGLAEIVARAPGRLRAFASLPLSDPEAARHEVSVRRGAAWAGYAVGTSLPDGTMLDDARFEYLLDDLARFGAFVFVHPVAACDPRLDKYYLVNTIGNPYETGIAAARLLFSGKAAHYDRIRFCFAHGGGTAPYLVGRWDRAHATKRPGIDAHGGSPRSLLRKFYFDSLTHDADALAFLVATVGADHVLIGSDYPFPMGCENPLGALAALSEIDRTRILSHDDSFFSSHSEAHS